MMKYFFIVSFILLTFIGCELENINEPFNYERDAPIWLKEKIDSISTNLYYGGTNVYRYKCSGSYFYYFDIPLSSCVYCEVYNENGNKIDVFANELLRDCLNNENNDVLVWSWKK